VKTVFTGIIVIICQWWSNTVVAGVNCNFCEFLAFGSSNLFTSSQAHNIKALLLSNELNNNYRGSVIAGSLGDGTCKFVLDE
jgi:galactitol-specific phosphotransferase system IIC component